MKVKDKSNYRTIICKWIYSINRQKVKSKQNIWEEKNVERFYVFRIIINLKQIIIFFFSCEPHGTQSKSLLKIINRRKELIHNMVLVVKNWLASAGDLRGMGWIPGSGRSPGEGNGNPLQYSCPGNPMDRGGWWAIVHAVSKSRTQLSD